MLHYPKRAEATTAMPQALMEACLVLTTKDDLTNMGELAAKATDYDISLYFDERTTWQLLQKNKFRSHLLDCSITSGYVAFQHLIFDPILNEVGSNCSFS